MVILMYDAENVESKFPRLRRHLNVIGHAHAKFAPIDFINKKKITRKRSKPNIPFDIRPIEKNLSLISS